MGHGERVQGKHQVPRFRKSCVSAVLDSSQGGMCLPCYKVPREVCVCRVTGFPGKCVSAVFTALAKYKSLGTLQGKEAYLAHRFGS